MKIPAQLSCFIKSKRLANVLFAAIVLPYLILSVTMGGFHDSIVNTRDCSHAPQLASSSDTDNFIADVVDDTSNHDSETCPLCQWLKTSSTLSQFFLHDSYFEYVCIVPTGCSNFVISSLSIQRFTIRPPPYCSHFIV